VKGNGGSSGSRDNASIAACLETFMKNREQLNIYARAKTWEFGADLDPCFDYDDTEQAHAPSTAALTDGSQSGVPSHRQPLGPSRSNVGGFESGFDRVAQHVPTSSHNLVHRLEQCGVYERVWSVLEDRGLAESEALALLTVADLCEIGLAQPDAEQVHAVGAGHMEKRKASGKDCVWHDSIAHRQSTEDERNAYV